MTAVNWLIEQLTYKSKENFFNSWQEDADLTEFVEQAKEMEKQQIIDASERLKWVDYSLVQNGEQYYNETYRSGVLTEGSGAVGKKGGAVNKGSDDQVPDVRKMVEDDNYLTPVDWLMDRIKWIHRETYDYLIKEGQYDVAKRTENAILDKTNEMVSSQTLISDEEIEKAADKYVSEDEFNRLLECFEQGAKWYREQLKSK